MQDSKSAEVTFTDLISSVPVETLHGLSSVVECECCRKKRQDANLHGWVVQHGYLRGFQIRTVSIPELAAYTRVTDRYRYRTSNDKSSVHDDLRSDEC